MTQAAENFAMAAGVDLSDAHILIIDDQDVLRKQIRSTLESNNHFNRFSEARDGLEGFQILLQNPNNIDVILCDVEMPQIDGFKFLALKRAKPELAAVPVIMLTTRAESENKIKGLELGASDYVLKPFDAGELIARTMIQLKLRRSIQTLQKQAEELELLSNTDPLTKLQNRRSLMQQTEKEFSRASRTGSDVGLILGDIDHFKSINDKFGHQVGDSVLVDVARILQNQAREHDIVARYGGEEFCIVLPETSIQDAQAVAERCRNLIEETSFTFGGEPVNVTMSFGVAAKLDSRTISVDDTLRRADVALYKAKDSGRNCVLLYNASEQTDF